MKLICVILLLGQLSTLLGDEAKKKEFFSQPLDEFTAIVLLQGAGDAHNLNHASSRLKNYMAVNSITEKSVREQLHALVTIDKKNFFHMMKEQKGIKEWSYDVVRAQAVYVLGELGDKSSIQVLEEYMNQINLTGEKHTDVYVSILKVSDFDRKYVLKYLLVDNGRIAPSVLQIMFTAYKKAIADGDTERVERLSKLIGELYYIEDHSEDYKEWVHRKFKYNKIPLSNIGVNAAAKESNKPKKLNSQVSLQEEKQTKPAKVSEKTPALQNHTVEKDDNNSWLIYLLIVLGIISVIALLKSRRQKHQG